MPSHNMAYSPTPACQIGTTSRLQLSTCKINRQRTSSPACYSTSSEPPTGPAPGRSTPPPPRFGKPKAKSKPPTSDNNGKQGSTHHISSPQYQKKEREIRIARSHHQGVRARRALPSRLPSSPRANDQRHDAHLFPHEHRKIVRYPPFNVPRTAWVPSPDAERYIE